MAGCASFGAERDVLEVKGQCWGLGLLSSDFNDSGP